MPTTYHCYFCSQEGVVDTNFTLWVEYIIEDLVMLANETFVKPGDVVLFNVTVSQLSRANTTIYYGDTHEDMEWRYEMLESRSTTLLVLLDAEGFS